MAVFELNIDGLVGPTHHYAGLSVGNLASINNAHSVANPAAAALQGFYKMRELHKLGFKQAVLPPHQRPNLHLLDQLGFRGTPAQQIKQAKTIAPDILSAAFSASSMWTANAATISPSTDTHDGRLHFTAANLISNLHRHQEADFSRLILQRIFADQHYFYHHIPLPGTFSMSDEGAANHNRFCVHHGSKGLHLFVYGKQAFPTKLQQNLPEFFPARQTLEASQAIVRNHLLDPHSVLYARQNPVAIDAGVFHNDVIAVANESVFLVHDQAFVNQSALLSTLEKKADFPLDILLVPSETISLTDAVKSYLFNAQLLTLPDSEIKQMILLAPIECEAPNIRAYLDRLVADPNNPIEKILFMDLKQSMSNGGGPACLRLRVPINSNEIEAMHQGVLINDPLLDTLEDWVHRHYRTYLHVDDLNDPDLMNECFTALDELTSILKLGKIYPFQLESRVVLSE